MVEQKEKHKPQHNHPTEFHYNLANDKKTNVTQCGFCLQNVVREPAELGTAQPQLDNTKYL